MHGSQSLPNSSAAAVPPYSNLPPAARSSMVSWFSFGLGIASITVTIVIFTFGLQAGIPAIVTGIIGIRESKRGGLPLWPAATGLTLGILGSLVTLVFFALFGMYLIPLA